MTSTTTATISQSPTSSSFTLPPINDSVPPLKDELMKVIQTSGGVVRALHPIGAEVRGIDLAGKPPASHVLLALEQIMAERGFVVFRDTSHLEVEELLAASCWWGGHKLHSTHGVHPATPGFNRHIFRLSNDEQHGILGVGPQWHNDGSFLPGPFSHVAYHMIKVPENGGGTHFAHLGAAYDALPNERQQFWERLSSVNSNGGVVHPLVHEHPKSKRKSLYLHLGMTGAVVERLASGSERDGEGNNETDFRLLNDDEMRELFNEYNDLLIAGFDKGYAVPYEYQHGDCIFIDNLAVAHRASPEAHLPAKVQGLRIMHRVTVYNPVNLKPAFGLPQVLDIFGPSPFGEGVWMAGGLGFRWDEAIHMQN